MHGLAQKMSFDFMLNGAQQVSDSLIMQCLHYFTFTYILLHCLQRKLQNMYLQMERADL